MSPRNTIVLRDGGIVDAGSLASARIEVVGTTSGAHAGRWALSDDFRTVVFHPDRPFAPGEVVSVDFRGGLRTLEGRSLPPVAYEFTVTTTPPGTLPRVSFAERAGLAEPVERSVAAPEAAGVPQPCDPLPPDAPAPEVETRDEPASGKVFIAPFTPNPNAPGQLMIVDNFGRSVFYRRFPTAVMDFKMQPNGLLTYFCCDAPLDGRQQFYALDRRFAVVDSFATGNGYLTDLHDLQLLPNGHALLMSYDPQRVGMDTVVARGDPDAIVVGLIIQELDAGKNVVFQWRSWDHFRITDTNSPTLSLTEPFVDYVHGNAVDLDHDGNLLLSSRNLSEITKIDRQTGEVIWRFGPNALRNDFAIEGDPVGFWHQHDIRRLPNGNVTLFDNNLQPHGSSRAVEYELDEPARRARLVWEETADPPLYAPFMGNVQRRSDGSTMIGWGWQNEPNLSDLHPDGRVALEIAMPRNSWSYRAFRFPWRNTVLAVDSMLAFGPVAPGATVSRPLVVRNTSEATLEVGCATTIGSAFDVSGPLPAILDPGASLTLDVTFHPSSARNFRGKLYVQVNGEDVIAQDVWLSGTGGLANAPPDVGGARPSRAELWPPDHALVPVAIEGVTDPDGDPVAITIVGVTHDEQASGATCPAAVVNGGEVLLRAERSGGGEGRVYRIVFDADDGRGGRSRGSVVVCVPHDRGRGPRGGGGCVPGDATTDALARCDGPGRGASAAAEAETGPSPAIELSVAALGVRGALATVTYALPAATDVELGVYDVTGRRVADLARARAPAGTHRLTWDASSLAPGMYFYRLRADGRTLTTPLSLVR